ncbi:hypothetical protein Pla52o_28660 [Novipirellula galeiformis]|uniref:VWFA domain-containing protein n=1 Tax=Novipirellula galeiformis TaxID=2528004 RepID=A0A5C6CFD4_9BACT|nr:hypothetical protein [Novipirellula galeiformis]TWU23330.1 hypothetical protein Pla52o_28660 [Novipirellula galeiformis]
MNRSANPTPQATGDSIAPSPGDRLELDLPDRPLPALLLSLSFHVVLLTSLGLFLAQTSSGTGSDTERPVGIAMVHRMPDRDRYVDVANPNPTATDEATAAESGEVSAAAAPPADLSPPIDLAGILSQMNATPSPVSGTGIAGETSLDGDAFDSQRPPGSEGDSNEATTMVFGISGSGSRFVYVFDRSDSMNGNGGMPLRAAKRELIQSLNSLTDRQRFQIIFYNDQPQPFQIVGVPLQLMQGEKATLARAQRYVDSITAYGSTEHDSALKLALRMDPDVIFFLTDARIPRLSTSQLGEIRRRAQRSGTTIHAIEFGADPLAPADSFLRDLAAQNLGQYQYVDIRSLGKNRQP